jgi:8-oxo-dGTP pyrophosphatase MutT (NUDIX family)
VGSKTATANPKLINAAVLVPLIPRPRETTVLLTRRAEHLRSHPGQICFPGGRRAGTDTDIAATALRETWEEIGISPSDVKILGYLDRVSTQSGFEISPVVGRVLPDFRLRVNDGEVNEVIEIPLALAMDSRRYSPISIGSHDQHQSEHFALRHNDVIIWGATARILKNLCHKLSVNTEFRRIVKELS